MLPLLFSLAFAARPWLRIWGGRPRRSFFCRRRPPETEVERRTRTAKFRNATFNLPGNVWTPVALGSVQDAGGVGGEEGRDVMVAGGGGRGGGGRWAGRGRRH